MKASAFDCAAAMVASISAWFLTRKGWRYVVKNQVEPYRTREGVFYRNKLIRTYLRLRKGQEEEEDGSDLPVEGNPRWCG